jgi:prephenate dehydratase
LEEEVDGRDSDVPPVFSKGQFMTKKIAFQGKYGSYSDLAARAAFRGHATLPCPSFLDTFIALESGKADLAMIPIDNSIAGRVADIHYLLPQYHLHFVSEYFLPIDHVLMGVKGAKLKDIKKVYSHVHALPQCRKFLRAHGLEPVVWTDTAGAAEWVAQMKDKSCAAIASAATAKMYGLDIIKRGVADAKDNVTRFLALSRHEKTPPLRKNGDYITSIIFSVKNAPAALYKVLGGFATNGVNMLKLESYMPGGAFASTLFYAELEGHRNDAPLARAIDEMQFFGKDVRVLGTYLADSWRKKRK